MLHIPSFPNSTTLLPFLITLHHFPPLFKLSSMKNLLNRQKLCNKCVTYSVHLKIGVLFHVFSFFFALFSFGSNPCIMSLTIQPPPEESEDAQPWKQSKPLPMKRYSENDENGYTVLVVKAGKSRVSAVGVMPPVTSGEKLRITGEWTEHPVYGRQIKVQSLEIEQPTTLSGIEKYLSSGMIRGVGPATAKLLHPRLRRKDARRALFRTGKAAGGIGHRRKARPHDSGKLCRAGAAREAMVFFAELRRHPRAGRQNLQAIRRKTCGRSSPAIPIVSWRTWRASALRRPTASPLRWASSRIANTASARA